MKRLDISFKPQELRLTEPPDASLGELSTSICFELSKRLEEEPKRLAEKIVGRFFWKDSLIAEATPVGGYINFRLDYDKAIPLIFSDLERQGGSYGFIKEDKASKVIVEHTSVNPVHPVHIGQARNSILGDALARMLRTRGHNVETHYYIDDMGRQTATLALGYNLLERKETSEKPDQFMGKVYTVTSCLVEIQGLKKQLEEAPDTSSTEKAEELSRTLDEWVSIAAELEAKYPELFKELSEAIMGKQLPESEINDLIVSYEQGEPSVKRLIRSISEDCLSGIKKTLKRLDVKIDSWDWESDLVWSGKVREVLERLSKTPYLYDTDATLELETEKIAQTLDLRRELGITATHHLPSLTLARSDGTTLYATRDIAYSLFKYSKTDRVINVIGAEQTLAQLQVKTALFAIGEEACAKNQIHFAFGLVETPGYKMSSRRGRVVTLDSVLDEAIARARQEVAKRSPGLDEDERDKIAEKIGKASIKYSLISIEPNRTVSFTWDRVLYFERNSAPFINYAYTRACGILRRIEGFHKDVDYTVLKHPLERALILKIAKFPSFFMEAADNLKPQELSAYANDLAEMFHEYYERVNVARAEEALRQARARLVEAVKIVLKNSMNVLGIDFSERM